MFLPLRSVGFDVWCNFPQMQEQSEVLKYLLRYLPPPMIITKRQNLGIVFRSSLPLFHAFSHTASCGHTEDTVGIWQELHPRLDSPLLSRRVNRASWIISVQASAGATSAWMQHLESTRLRSSRSVNTWLSGAYEAKLLTGVYQNKAHTHTGQGSS